MDFTSVTLAVVFLVIAYLIFDRYLREGLRGSDSEIIGTPADSPAATSVETATTKTTTDPVTGKPETVREVVYTQDYYPWWRSTRWWNYDGWLYQKPYYNYWRRPYYYNYWMSGRPLIIGGKRYYQREFW